MNVALQTLQPNPLRDFTVDPLEEEAVERLRKSIEHDGFWGGVICRQLPDGTVQIGAGHHRIEAAKRAGITHADLYVRQDLDDAGMARVYAQENATQRGTTSTAVAGSIASAIRVLAKGILIGDTHLLLNSTEDHAIEDLQGQLLNGHGIGRPLIKEFLTDVHGMTVNVVQSQLDNLKASGDYARIIIEVCEGILSDLSTDAQVIERTQQAFMHVQGSEVTFDFSGVAKHFTNIHQVNVFRKVVTGKALKEVLPVARQAPLAQHLVQLARDRNGAELSGAFISNNVMSMLTQARGELRQWSQREEAAARQEDRHRRVLEYDRDLTRAFRLISKMGQALRTLRKEWPKEIPFPIRSAFQEQQREAMEIMTILKEEIRP